MVSTPQVFHDLFAAAYGLMETSVLPRIAPDGDPDPMMLVLFKGRSAPALVALPPVHLYEKDRYALVMAALVQALDPVAVAPLMAVWLRSATPNREAIMVSCADRELSAMGMIFIQRNSGKPPTIEDAHAPIVADQESGRFAGLFHQDVSALPAEFLEVIRRNAAAIREQLGVDPSATPPPRPLSVH